MQRVELEHTTLAVMDSGSGPPILLVHGFPLNHTMWRRQIEHFSKSHRVIAPDLRGFGDSSIEQFAAKSGVSMADYADDLAALLEQLGVAEPVVYCGFSMGGYIAWQFFERHRQKLKALVLCDTKAAADEPAARAVRYKMAENIEGWGSAHVARLMSPKMFAAATISGRPELVAEFEQVVAATDPVAIAASQRGMAHRPDSTPLLKSIDVRALYLVGAEDAITPPEAAESMAAATPGSKLVVIDAAGHMSPLENPQAVNAAMEEFLGK